jgi:hypothetical protein
MSAVQLHLALKLCALGKLGRPLLAAGQLQAAAEAAVHHLRWMTLHAAAMAAEVTAGEAKPALAVSGLGHHSTAAAASTL